MKPLIVLTIVFCIVLIVTKFLGGEYNISLSGRIAMSAMLIFTAIGHFVYTKGMSMMLPDGMPFKTEIVYLTGMIEIIAAIGLLIPNLRLITAWLLIVFFICVLPTNIYSAIRHLNYQTGTFNGKGPIYLWFRIPLQILFMVWTYLSAIKN